MVTWHTKHDLSLIGFPELLFVLHALDQEQTPPMLTEDSG